MHHYCLNYQPSNNVEDLIEFKKMLREYQDEVKSIGE